MSNVVDMGIVRTPIELLRLVADQLEAGTIQATDVVIVARHLEQTSHKHVTRDRMEYAVWSRGPGVETIDGALGVLEHGKAHILWDCVERDD